MILFDETLRQKTDDGTPFAQVLADKDIIPGIKVDTGAHDLALHPGEKVTEGLDGLRARLKEYYELGARFAKWRSVITIGESMPSPACLEANTHGLARYAALCQEAGLVPMVEPEIIMEGEHSLENCYEVSVLTWKVLFEQLKVQGVDLKGTILKTSMIFAGTQNTDRTDHETVAEMTIKGLKEAVPAELAGVVFLSGGQSDSDSTIHLNLMNAKFSDSCPWPLSFSYGRGIQAPALALWGADPAGNYEEAKKALAHRAKMNSLATQGKWSADMES
jgi:fructose-bisphosphate aldolase class I